MSRFVIDLDYLRTMHCEDPNCDCGGTGGPHRGSPLAIAGGCHPQAPVIIDYEGGDRLIVRCAVCRGGIGDIIVGERARVRT
ncbi:MAG TPA: hypothetical protein VN903_28650 [Polyangia bacterium]|nr:hypothetical protein [Polyangia bacterium]